MSFRHSERAGGVLMQAAMLHGFFTRHCKKASAKEADQRLAGLEQACAETLPDGTSGG